MPGANSRFTGSATSRNVFAPSSMLHGSADPLGVTTGVYRPLPADAGSMSGPAGSAAVADRLLRTAALPSNAAPVVSRSRRFNGFLVINGNVGGLAGVACRWGQDSVVAARL